MITVRNKIIGTRVQITNSGENVGKICIVIITTRIGVSLVARKSKFTETPVNFIKEYAPDGFEWSCGLHCYNACRYSRKNEFEATLFVRCRRLLTIRAIMGEAFNYY